MLRCILRTYTEGVKIAIESISINPTISATIKYKYLKVNQPIENYEYVMDGEQYARWGNDDTILYHILCARHNVQYKPFVEPEFLEEIVVSKDEQTGEMKSEIIRKPNPKYVTT